MTRFRDDQGFTLVELMAVVGLIGVLAAMVIPITDTSLQASRLRRDAEGVRNLVSLAKMRSSSRFTRARVMVNLNTNAYGLQVWDRAANTWVTERGPFTTSSGIRFGFGTLGAPPPNTQAAIGMSPACSVALSSANLIANTACITFNSRGLPVDADGVLFPGHGLYVIGRLGVYATTVTATPLIRFWASPPTNAVWTAK